MTRRTQKLTVKIIAHLLLIAICFSLFPAAGYAAGIFSDVADPGKYYYVPVYWARDNGITTGTSPTTFSPNDDCTREQIVTFLWRMSGEPEPSTYAGFADVSSDKWYYKPVSWAAENGITTGYAGSNRFGVGDPCTREQCVTFLWRAAGKPASNGENSFTDMAAGAYYVDAVAWAANQGVTTGLNDGTGRFGVGQTCTRAMIVTFLYRFSKLNDNPTLMLYSDKNEVSVASDGIVFFYAQANCNVNEVLLLNADTHEVVASMVDDGRYEESGDDLPGDRIFTARIGLDTSITGVRSFYATASGAVDLESDTVDIATVADFTDEELDEMAEVETKLQEELFEVNGFETMSISERKAIADDLLTEMSNESLVEDDSVLYDEANQVLTFVYSSGALGAVLLSDWDPEQNGEMELEEEVADYSQPDDRTELIDDTAIDSDSLAEMEAELTQQVVEEEKISENADEDDPPLASEDKTTESESEDADEDDPSLASEEEITESESEDAVDSSLTELVEEVVAENKEEQSDKDEAEIDTEVDLEAVRMEARRAYEERKAQFGIPAADEIVEGLEVGKALILWSFEQAWDNDNYRRPFYAETEAEWETKGLDTDVIYDTTVDSYKGLRGYDVIVFSGHGSYETYKDGIIAPNKTTVSSLILHEKSTWSKDSQYSADLKAFRVGKISVPGGTMYAILPEFFNYYYGVGDLSGSFIFAENCEFYGKNGNVNNYMSNVLYTRMAESVIGFHNSVMADYSREFMKTYVNALIEGGTTREAFNAAINKHGENDYFTGRQQYGPTAYPIFNGNNDSRLIGAGIRNGDFEDANTLSSWSRVGDTRGLSQLGSLYAYSNHKMAIITTGIGSAEKDYLAGTEGSVISQVVNIPSNATTLSFYYDFVSEEPTEFVGSQYDDTFEVQIVTDSGTDIIYSNSINTASWYGINGIDFDGGDETTYHTNWIHEECDISQYAGQNVNIRFVIYDVGDSIYDSAVLLDAVSLS